VKVSFTADGWRDYLHWVEHDRKLLAIVNRLIEDVRREPFSGLGKPEPLKGELAGWWSRRVTAEHRFVYRVEGARGDQHVIITQCRHHY
jgi:toxin YoeB